jgi:hypothetical protein
MVEKDGCGFRNIENDYVANLNKVLGTCAEVYVVHVHDYGLVTLYLYQAVCVRKRK